MDLNMVLKSAMLRIGNPIKQCTVGNYIINVDIREGIQKGIYLGCYEPDETKWLHEVLKPGMTFFDVGANVGYYSFIASSLVGKTGKVFAFEPSNIAYHAFMGNIKNIKIESDNKMYNIYVSNFALGEKEDDMELFSADGLPDNIYNIHSPSFLNRKDQHYLKEGNIGINMGFKHVTTLDAFCKTCNIDHIDFIKIDVEGMEFPVLKGMKSLLDNKQVDYIMIEFLEEKGMVFDEGSESKEMSNFIDSYNFKILNTKRYDDRYWNVLYRRGDLTVH